jgi:hypothetical protein
VGGELIVRGQSSQDVALPLSSSLLTLIKSNIPSITVARYKSVIREAMYTQALNLTEDPRPIIIFPIGLIIVYMSFPLTGIVFKEVDAGRYAVVHQL